MTPIVTKSIELAKRSLVLETGKLASQATSAVLGRFGDTMVLVAVVEGQERPDLGYFPLMVEYVERLYAGGKIKGSRWVKREGRPSDEAILTARLIDRSIRPLFPKEYKKEVQVVVTVLSVDGENPPDVLSIITTSAALAISPIPWNGPIGAVRIGRVKEKNNGAFEFLVNPESQEVDFSELDLVVVQTGEKTVMIEAGGREIPEDKILEALSKAESENQKIVNLITEFAKEMGVKKHEVSEGKDFKELILRVKKKYQKELKQEVKTLARKEGGAARGINSLVDKIFDEEGGKEASIENKNTVK